MASKAFVIVPVLAALMYGTLNSRLWPKFHFALGDSISLVCIAATIWRVIHIEDIASRFLNTKTLVVIGTLSYSLYIWQQLFLNAGSTYWINAFPQNLIFAFLAAAASYYLVESPVLRLRTRLVTWMQKRAHAGEGMPQDAPDPATVEQGITDQELANQDVANQVSA
jgi:peptidoglycan/LPS O-acetylase OafA/YrhL